ncbi:MAG: hypothetical protein MHMPM18_003227 [Marteilia pararefringens]
MRLILKSFLQLHSQIKDEFLSKTLKILMICSSMIIIWMLLHFIIVKNSKCYTDLSDKWDKYFIPCVFLRPTSTQLLESFVWCSKFGNMKRSVDTPF